VLVLKSRLYYPWIKQVLPTKIVVTAETTIIHILCKRSSILFLHGQ